MSGGSDLLAARERKSGGARAQRRYEEIATSRTDGRTRRSRRSIKMMQRTGRISCEVRSISGGGRGEKGASRYPRGEERRATLIYVGPSRRHRQQIYETATSFSSRGSDAISSDRTSISARVRPRSRAAAAADVDDDFPGRAAPDTRRSRGVVEISFIRSERLCEDHVRETEGERKRERAGLVYRVINYAAGAKR